MSILITGSSGLIGSEAVEYFGKQGHKIIGVDNNMRQAFFGPEGSTLSRLSELLRLNIDFQHIDADIRKPYDILDKIYAADEIELVIHCAAQPSHDLAARMKMEDFEVNALGTLQLLNMMQFYFPEAVFVYMSTNKVYGSNPNKAAMKESLSRIDYEHIDGIDESCPIDYTTHSFFGVSKLSGDLLVQEFGNNLGLKTVSLRAGCLTGPNHQAVELHGFLAYLAKCFKEDRTYTVYGHRGKQVRDNIHSYDVCTLIEHIWKDPPTPGSVFNIGGGRSNSVSILEAIEMFKEQTYKEINVDYTSTPRVGDHICYITDDSKVRNQYPSWHKEYSVSQIIRELCQEKESHAL